MTGKKNVKNNVTIALDVLYSKKYIYPAYVSKHKPNREKQFILLMISSNEKRHYLDVKKLSALSKEITSKNNDAFYCLNCLYYFRTKNKLELHKRVCENKDFCNVIMPFEDTKILELNQYQ